MFSRQQPPSSLPTQPSIDSCLSPSSLTFTQVQRENPLQGNPMGHCSLSHLSPVCQSSECIIKFILKRKSKFLIPSKVRRSHHFKIIFGSINSPPNSNAPSKRSLSLSAPCITVLLYTREKTQGRWIAKENVSFQRTPH